jgi:adenylate cyclase
MLDAPMTEQEQQTYNEEFWHEFLTKGDMRERVGRRVYRRLPHGPRCRMCAAPFEGMAAPLMRLIGKQRATANPNMCTSCFTFMDRHHGGAEIEGAMLFADIRGSTALAETMSPGEFRTVLERFYNTATNVVFEHDGYIDKFVGDELVALFFPLLAGEQYTARAVETATALLRATGHGDPSGPWVPLGAGVHSGRAWFGVLGDDEHREMTAVGDAMNTTARLAASAGEGEVLVSTAAADAAGLEPTLEHRQLELKGKREPFEAVVVRV